MYTKESKSLQAQIIDSELTAKLLGRGVAVSPVVTVEPRRRKFHKAITLSMPAPRPHTQGMTNQYSTSSAPTLRLLCSISGTLKIFRLHFSIKIVFGDNWHDKKATNRYDFKKVKYLWLSPTESKIIQINSEKLSDKFLNEVNVGCFQ